jgi:Xaa-Pro dipeptidase
MNFEKIVEQMSEANMESMLLLDKANITYLSGYKPSSFSVLIVKDEPSLLIPKLDLEEANNLSTIPVEEFKSLKEVFSMLTGEVGVEKSMPAFYYQKLMERFDLRITNIIENFRMIKSKKEINLIEKALKIAESSIKHVEFSGTENKVAAELEYYMKLNGSLNPAFDTMVASGTRSAFPHATCSQNPLESPILLDWGAEYNNYVSDTSRTIINNEYEEEIFEIVLESQKEAIKNIKPGVKCSYIDKVARNVIAEYGYAENFIHSTGHGMGLDVHEDPSLSVRDKTHLEKGMVVTVEPGIYLPDQFGIRTEDMVLVKSKGRVLNKLKTRLEIST